MSNTSNYFVVGQPIGVLPLDGSFTFGPSNNNSLFNGTGNVTITSNLSLGNWNNNSNAATIVGPASGQYKLTLPSISNTSNVLPYAQNSLTISQSGQTTFTPAELVAVTNIVGNTSNVYSTPQLLTSTQMVCVQCYTQAQGLITIYPTNNSTSSGSPIFPNAILNVSAMAMNSSQYISGSTFVSLQSISSDLKTIILNATQPTTVLIGGSTLSPAPAGIKVNLIIVGY